MVPALTALVLAAALCLLFIRIGPRLGFVSRPGRERDIHTRPVAFGGGAAMYVGFAVAAAAALPATLELIGIVVLSGVTTAVYALDDRVGFRPLIKLALQIAVAVVAVEVFHLVIGDVNLGVLHIDLGLLALPVTVLWIVGMQNTVNLLDGVDGLAAGVVGIVALVLMIAATMHLDKPGQREALVLSGILAGACAGFLIFNFNPARIFMGDSGSQFLGLSIALLAILGVAKVAVAAALLVPVMALAVPIVDTALAVVRRRRRGLSIAQADSRHIHHHLLDFGLSQRETCLLFYGATAILGAVGLSVFGHRRILAAVIALVLVVVAVLMTARLSIRNRSIPVPGWRIVTLIRNGRGEGGPEGGEPKKSTLAG